jgi:hypothetical protein
MVGSAKMAESQRGKKILKIFFLLEALGEKNCYRFFEIGVYPRSGFGPIIAQESDQMMMEND